MKKTAIAPANIALVKYWGKRNEELILPHNSSISMTLDKLYTITTVEFDESYSKYEINIDGKDVIGEEYNRVVKQLEMLKKYSDIEYKAKMVSKGNFPKKRDHLR